MDQGICIEFYCKTEIKCSNVLKILKLAFGRYALSETKSFHSYKYCQDGHEEVKDDERPGSYSPYTTDNNVEKVNKMIMNDHRIILSEFADDVGKARKGTCQSPRLKYKIKV